MVDSQLGLYIHVRFVQCQPCPMVILLHISLEWRSALSVTRPGFHSAKGQQCQTRKSQSLVLRINNACKACAYGDNTQFSLPMKTSYFANENMFAKSVTYFDHENALIIIVSLLPPQIFFVQSDSTYAKIYCKQAMLWCGQRQRLFYGLTILTSQNRDNTIKHCIKSLQVLYHAKPFNHVLQVLPTTSLAYIVFAYFGPGIL